MIRLPRGLAVWWKDVLVPWVTMWTEEDRWEIRPEPLMRNLPAIFSTNPGPRGQPNLSKMVPEPDYVVTRKLETVAWTDFLSMTEEMASPETMGRTL